MPLVPVPQQEGGDSRRAGTFHFKSIGADWYVFSGHKLFGPTGIGVVYGRESLLNATEPWQRGGNMIEDVTFEHTHDQPAPSRFEAGAGNIADAVGLGVAIDYLTALRTMDGVI